MLNGVPISATTQNVCGPVTASRRTARQHSCPARRRSGSTSSPSSANRGRRRWQVIGGRAAFRSSNSIHWTSSSPSGHAAPSLALTSAQSANARPMNDARLLNPRRPSHRRPAATPASAAATISSSPP